MAKDKEFYLGDLLFSHADELLQIVSDKDFFYPYINQKKDGDRSVDLVGNVQNYCWLAQYGRESDPVAGSIQGVFKENTHELMGACVLGSVKPTASGGMEAELGAFLAVKYQRQGIGWPAIVKMIQWGQNRFGLTELWASFDPEFEHSQAIVQKLGMEKIDYIEHSNYNDREGNNRPRVKFRGKPGHLDFLKSGS